MPPLMEINLKAKKPEPPQSTGLGKDPSTLVVGQVYKTRDGRQVKIIRHRAGTNVYEGTLSGYPDLVLFNKYGWYMGTCHPSGDKIHYPQGQLESSVSLVILPPPSAADFTTLEEAWGFYEAGGEMMYRKKEGGVWRTYPKHPSFPFLVFTGHFNTFYFKKA